MGSCTIFLAPLSQRVFSIISRSSCKKWFCRWWKSARVSFPTIGLAESDPVVAEPPETARLVGREITFLEELACCPALLESDTHEEVPTQGKEGSCRCFMKHVKKCSSYRLRTFTSPRGTYCASERPWNINILTDGKAYFVANCACLMTPQSEILVNLLQPGMSKRSRRKNERLRED